MPLPASSHGIHKQNMLLKLRATLELLKLCPGILSRVSPRVINTDFRYATGLSWIRKAPKDKQPYLAACIMLHELCEHDHIHTATLNPPGRQALNVALAYYRELHDTRHRHVHDEVRERSGLNTPGSILQEIHERQGTGQ